MGGDGNSPLTTDVSTDIPGWALVAVRGDIDVTTVSDLAERLAALIDDRYDHVVLDLAGVDFCDSSGLHCLFETHRRASEAGVHFGLAAAQEYMVRLLTIVGFVNVIPTFPTVADALAEAPGLAREAGGDLR